MKLLFWTSVLLIAYSYIGYALYLYLSLRFGAVPVRRAAATPRVSIVIAARNEEANLPAKLRDIEQANYPQEKIQIIVASDGSTDGTVDVLRSHPRVCTVILDHPGGKACALNQAVERATGEILVFLDARQALEAGAIAALISCFADPSIGAVSGELLLDQNTLDGVGLYWLIEKYIRKLESATGSVVGVTGAIYAIRRELFMEMPPGTLLDDVYVPMEVARKGKRVIFEPSAIARDKVFTARGKEFSRKVRTLTGNYQLLQLQPWLLTRDNPLLFRFVSHKLLRLFVPLFLAIALFSSGLCSGTLYHICFWTQGCVYLLALLGTWKPSTRQWKPIAVANTFVMLNAAAAVAFYNFVTGKDRVWV